MTRQNRLIFYIGGSEFYTLPSTITKRCGSKWLQNLLDKATCVGNGEYFLDRNPKMFSCILDYCRTGTLHLPHNICGPFIREELSFWDISPTLIEPCCWSPFTTDEQVKHAGKEVIM